MKNQTIQNKNMTSIREIGDNKYLYGCNTDTHNVSFDESVKYFEPYENQIKQLVAVSLDAVREIVNPLCNKRKNALFVGEFPPEFNNEKYHYDLCVMIDEKISQYPNVKRDFGVDELDVSVEMGYCFEGGNKVYVCYDLKMFDDAGECVLQIMITH